MLDSIFFITLCLTINHLYSVSALPSVSKDNVTAGQSLSLTHALVKRDWAPADQTCTEPEDWHSRNCIAQAVDRIWYDTCIDIEGDVSYGYGICPEDTICMNAYGPLPEQAPTIMCVFRPTCTNCGPNITGGPPPANGQTGVRLIGTDPAPVRAVSVSMVGSISGASVTAFIEGTDGGYLVAPNSPMNGVLRSISAQTCAFNVTNRDCVPLGTWNLETGDTIDFTFGLQPWQIVRFYYGIFGGGY